MRPRVLPIKNDRMGGGQNVKGTEGPVKLIKRVKIAHSFSKSVSNQFHVIILGLPV